MSFYEIFIQLIGFLGLLASLISFQFKKHKHIVLMKMLSEAIFAVQYLFFGAYTAAAMDMLSGTRNYLFSKNVEKGKSTLPVILIFSTIVIIAGALTYTGPLSLLPVAAKLITTVAYGLKNEKYLRLVTLPSCFIWITYNLVIGVWAGAISDLLTLGSITISIYKFDIRGAKNK